MKIGEAFVELRPDSSRFAAEAKVEVSRILDAIEAAVKITADATGLRAEVAAAAAAAGAGQEVEIPVKTDDAPIRRAGSAFKDAQREADKLAGNLSAMPAMLAAIATGATQAVGGIFSLGAGAVALGGALAPLIGLLGALPSLAAGGGLGVGVLGFGLSGVGEAVSSLGEAQASAAKDAKTHAEAVAAAARQVRDAGYNVEQSERTLSRALKESEEAQEALTEARVDAKRRLEDLNEAVQDGALTEEQAILRLDRARENLRKGVRSGSPLIDREQAQRDLDAVVAAYERARGRLADLTTRGAPLVDVQQARNDAQAAGRAVEAAQATLTQSGRGVSLLDRRQLELDVRSAEDGLEDVRRQRARNQEDAAKANAEGVEGSDQVQAAVDREARAREGITDALRGATRAHEAAALAAAAQTKVLTEQTGAAKAAKDAFDKLSPAGREFATYLNSLRPVLRGLKDEVGAAFLPALQAGVQTFVTTLFPTFRGALVDAADGISDFIEKGSAMFTSGPFAADVKTMFGDTGVLMRDLGDATLFVVDGFRHVVTAAGPMIRALGDMASKGGKAFADAAAAGRESGALGRFFDQAVVGLKLTIDLLFEWGRVIANVFRAAAPMGNEMLRTWAGIVKNIGDATGTLSGQRGLGRFFETMKPILSGIGNLVGEVLKGLLKIATTVDFTPLTGALNAIADRVIPKLVELIQDVAPLGDALLNLVTSLANNPDFLDGLADGLKAIAGVAADIVNFITFVIEKVPGADSALGALVGTFFGFKIVLGVLGLVAGQVLGIAGAVQKLGAVIAAEGIAGKLAAMRAPVGSAAAGAASGAAGGGLGALAAAAAVPALVIGSVLALAKSFYDLGRNYESLKTSFRDKGTVEGVFDVIRTAPALLAGIPFGGLLSAILGPKGLSDAQKAAIEIDKVKRATERLTAADREHASALRGAARAQEDLRQAREDALQQIADLNEQVRDGADDEEQALLDLERAKEARRTLPADATNVERRQAELDFRRAEDRLDDVRQRRRRDQAEAAEANKKGVEGSEIVQRALDRVKEANERVSKAADEVEQALRDVPPEARGMMTRVAGAINDGKPAVAAAAKGVGEAIRDGVLADLKTLPGQINGLIGAGVPPTAKDFGIGQPVQRGPQIGLASQGIPAPPTPVAPPRIRLPGFGFGARTAEAAPAGDTHYHAHVQAAHNDPVAAQAELAARTIGFLIDPIGVP